MERRDFLKNLTAAGVLSMFDPGYLNAKETLATGTTPDNPLERRSSAGPKSACRSSVSAGFW